MALKKMKLAKNIKRALDKMESHAKAGRFKTPDEPNEYLGRKIAEAIDIYIREADVEGQHIIPMLKINGGIKIISPIPPYGTPAVGNTISLGSPAPRSNEGPFGKNCYPGGKGKIQ
tara:strand:- start:812 stop:1159 length:348 start_codon:yes stop_codon:yes gene_type:complete